MPKDSAAHPQAPTADADLLGEDASFDGHIEKPAAGQPERATSKSGVGESAAGAGATRQDTVRRESGGGRESGDAEAGKDINQAGFLKDEDAAKP